jgi:hypothetical protein
VDQKGNVKEIVYNENGYKTTYLPLIIDRPKHFEEKKPKNILPKPAVVMYAFLRVNAIQ